MFVLDGIFHEMGIWGILKYSEMFMLAFTPRRLNTLNKCVEMKLDLSRFKRQVS